PALLIERLAVFVGNDPRLAVSSAGRRPLIGDLQLVEAGPVEDANLARRHIAHRARIDGGDTYPHRDSRRQVQVLIGDELGTAVNTHDRALGQRGRGGPLASDQRFTVCFVAANCAIGGDLDAAGGVHSHTQHGARQSRGGRVGGFYVWVDGHVDGLADRPSLWHQRDVHLRVDDQQRRG